MVDLKTLFKKLREHPLTDIREERRGFKKLARKIEVKIKKNVDIKLKPPIYFILKDYCVSNKYLNCDNTKYSFKVKKFNFERMLREGEQNPKFDGKILLPVHIENRIFGKAHLNVLIVNTKTKKVTRLDPSREKTSRIYDRNVSIGLNKFFNKRGYEYTGYSKKSKIILHGGLCRYATPALYIHGKKLTHPILKEMVINYLVKINNIIKKHITN